MKPAVTVAIPTYNWSAALRCAIRSVLLQTVKDFEVLVVGDGCTDDSADVVAGFRDPRLRWFNLEKNHGSQWAADNFAIEHAAADWIAYLGHDDIWYPTHLEAVLRTARDRRADLVTSAMIMYGPPGVGVRAVPGVFAGAAMSADDFVPPSAFAHSRAFVDGIRWPAPQATALPVDVVFLRSLMAASARAASTNEVTCFKFNAAWRRDAYKIRSVAEQEAMLKRIESGADFRHAELLEVVRSVVADKFLRIRIPDADGLPPGWFWRLYARNKGLANRHEPSQLRRIERPTRFHVTGQEMPFEWHELENDPVHGSFRWTGPSPHATIDLPVVFDRDLAIRIHVLVAASSRSVTDVRLALCGRSLECRVEITAEGTYLIHATARRPPAVEAETDFALTLTVDPLVRPSDLGPSPDVRWLGLAVNWVELEPLPTAGNNGFPSPGR